MYREKEMQRWPWHSCFHFHIFYLKDSKEDPVSIISGTLLKILGAIYEIVSVLYLTVLELPK